MTATSKSRTAHRRVVIAVLLTLLLTSCGLSKSDDGGKDDARKLVEKFVAAVAEGDFKAAGALTTEPDVAASELEFTTNRLGGAPVEFRIAQLKSSVAEGSVDFAVTWQLDPDHSWAYDSTAQLITDDQDDWKLVWKTAVIHPDLTGGVTLLKSPIIQSAPVVTDRNGQALLAAQLVTVVRIDPAAVTDPAGTSAALAAALGPVVPSITAESVQAQLAGATEAFSLVALRPELAAQVTVPELPGVTSNKQERLLAIGGGPRPTALTGIDDVYQQVADRATGWRITLRDASDATVQEYLAVQPDPSSTSLPTTLDATLQSAAQAAVDAVPQQAMIVAIQPSTGGILAVAQNAAASTEGPVALTGQYPPGSTFKIVTFGAALGNGSVTPDTTVDCPGSATIGGRTIPNDSGFALGSVPLRTAFAQSCNTTAAALAIDLPADALSGTAQSFGVGMDYEISGMTTITGKVPASANDAEQVEASIGQGKVVASPFGMALAAATVAAGATPVPMLLPGHETTVNTEAAALPPGVSDALQSMMAQTVTSGTATALDDITGLKGKTGTAQFGDGTHSHGWFVGVYQDLAFAVLIVDAGSSGPAVATAGQFLRPVLPNVPRS